MFALGTVVVMSDIDIFVLHPFLPDIDTKQLDKTARLGFDFYKTVANIENQSSRIAMGGASV